eukprot:TRINITY_DN13977_c0_g1_i1.p1 TRINITY_DN13977_c0_g1~~TRINITY_DN13977_c0_g1_i1.p1  ORF type:complete len:580 (+),score=87.96 TRINITY_DN13977_c0_g1_i1:69-1808(+)
MIYYKSDSFFSKVCRIQGSVAPMALAVAVPCGIITFVLKFLSVADPLLGDYLEGEQSILNDSAAWNAFSSLTGFLVVFRTSQAYARFWDGCSAVRLMHSNWYEACSTLLAYTRYSQAPAADVDKFKNIIVRLFSMLHAVALAEVEDSSTHCVEDVVAFEYDLVDPSGIDPKSLARIKHSGSKVELVFFWIQALIVEYMQAGVINIPPPLLTRSIQELDHGMVACHDALKISTIPFPFPYAQTCDVLLAMHWFVSPFVVCSMTYTPWWAFVLATIQSFILWSLNFISTEIENPFGMDANDLDGSGLQDQFNENLVRLYQLSKEATPTLSPHVEDLCEGIWGMLNLAHSQSREESTRSRQSFKEVWTDLDALPPATSYRGEMVKTSTMMTGAATDDSGAMVAMLSVDVKARARGRKKDQAARSSSADSGFIKRLSGCSRSTAGNSSGDLAAGTLSTVKETKTCEAVLSSAYRPSEASLYVNGHTNGNVDECGQTDDSSIIIVAATENSEDLVSFRMNGLAIREEERAEWKRPEPEGEHSMNDLPAEEMEGRRPAFAENCRREVSFAPRSPSGTFTVMGPAL